MEHCSFCHDILQEDKLLETSHFFLIFDHAPIQTGHLLLISKEHSKNITELPDDHLVELIRLEKRVIFILEQQLAIEGITVIQNNGKLMDKGIHFHLHLIPRFYNDEFWENHSVRQHQLYVTKLQELLSDTSKN